MIDSTPRRPALHKRRFIVDRHFQHRVIRTLLGAWLAHTVFLGFNLHFFYGVRLHQFYEISPRAGVLPRVSPAALLLLSAVSIAVFGLVFFLLVAIYMSHQIAGPLYRAKQGLDRVGRGEWSFHLQFRRGDFLRDFPVAFNNMLDSLRHQTEVDLEELREAEAFDDDPLFSRRIVRKQIERKEAQLGLGPETGGDPRESPAASLTVH